ncbi:hypothetical protein H8356DRAFT_1362550 [Neocallimastix lanati (nom. inval.)]|nr:hypothetical protein H8356DRAFT_1362550 [Neocallimastix sp. JGI-2020a]
MKEKKFQQGLEDKEQERAYLMPVNPIENVNSRNSFTNTIEARFKTYYQSALPILIYNAIKDIIMYPTKNERDILPTAMLYFIKDDLKESVKKWYKMDNMSQRDDPPRKDFSRKENNNSRYVKNFNNLTAFQNLKEILTYSSMLPYPDNDK